MALYAIFGSLKGWSRQLPVAPGFVVERVEYGEGGRPHLNSEPRNRSRFSVHQRYGGAQKICDLFVLALLRFQWNVQCKFRHHFLLLSEAPLRRTTAQRPGVRPENTDCTLRPGGCVHMLSLYDFSVSARLSGYAVSPADLLRSSRLKHRAEGAQARVAVLSNAPTQSITTQLLDFRSS